MPVNIFARSAIAGILAFAASSLTAMTPEIRLPEWQRSKIDISEWKPDQKLLTIRVDIEAPSVQLEKITSKLHLPEELGVNAGQHERPFLKKGDKVVFLHKFSVKPDFAGWAEVELAAQPSQDGVLALIKSAHANEPATAAILEAEARTIDKPLNFGRSMPLLVRDDIALCTAVETALKPDFKVNGQQFYFWYPESGFGKGLTSEGLKAFTSAIGNSNLKSAEAAGNMLIKKLETSKEPLMLSRTKDETFAIPAPVAIDLINANLATLQAIVEKSPETLEKDINAMQPGYTRPFLMFNLASLYETQKKSGLAKLWYEKAISEIPAWPLAETSLKRVRK
ncbi:MAG TPA: hypothetical protein PLK28_02620 [Candidatus Rifleibacterium sp.]|nr:hypothetical protein [Candidatus Rifleibacterium sp.]